MIVVFASLFVEAVHIKLAVRLLVLGVQTMGISYA